MVRLPNIRCVTMTRNPTICNIIRWFAGTNDSSTKRLGFHVLFFFFIISCKILCKNCFNLFFYEFTKMKIISFECPKSIKNYIKNNAWNITRLADDSFVPENQRTSTFLACLDLPLKKLMFDCFHICIPLKN